MRILQLFTTKKNSTRTQRKVLFVAIEDWFFVSHFLPMARAGIEEGLEVVVATRVRSHMPAIASTGARVVSFDTGRGSISLIGATRTVLRLVRILKREKPDIIHCISLKPILIGGTAALFSSINARVFALTGVGFLGVNSSWVSRGGWWLVRILLTRILNTRRTNFLFENEDDPLTLGLHPNCANVTIVGGAGIDPSMYVPAPLPNTRPLKVAIVSRMIWSKGIDLAVNAVSRCRDRGIDITLSLYGASDTSNPKAISEGQLRAWSELDGITWHGPTQDVCAVWASHHVACLPSRGGEGLPRTLLEAASCGRAIVTTNVPGCRSLVRNDIDGLVIPPDDVAALERAFEVLATHPKKVIEMGASARERILDGYTERDVMEQVKRLYRSMISAV